MTGIGKYVAGVAAALPDVDPSGTYSLVTNRFFARRPKVPIPIEQRPPRLRHRPIRMIPGRTFNWLRDRNFPLDVILPGKDVFLFTNYATYPLWRTPYVVIVYDLSYLVVPECILDGYRSMLASWIPPGVAGAAAVVTVSEAVKSELVHWLGVAADRVVVAPPAVDAARFRPVPTEQRAALRRELGVPDRYFLFVGTIEPRKNIRRLVDAYATLPDDVRAEHALVLVGSKGWLDDDILDAVEELRRRGEQVVQPGYVPDEALPALYADATAFVYPSLYEGFGMPVMEAMACGAPVITSNVSSLPEAAGGAGLLVDPLDVRAISNAMARVARDEQLAADLRERGRERAARTDWRRTAELVHGALVRAATSP
jgi:glycosyltransferase involved in cell wall biosynthesis